ncbi:hypothetical protein MCOR08_000654 [Pyricularia oryzae]|nr:hypothetical protein MCOR08_000654 [Pyricularia oryzae]
MPCLPLPTELWLAILEPLAREIITAKRSGRFLRPGYGALASVCRHWQLIFEPRIFEHLTLRVADVQCLNLAVRERRRHLVKHIWFIVEFPMYSCYDYELDRQAPLDNVPSDCFWNGISCLFRELSMWGAPYARGDTGITLELSMWSPSDNMYSFQDIDFGEGDCLDPFPDVEEDFQRHASFLHAPYHGWVQGSRFRSATTMEWQRIRHFIHLREEDDMDMPSVVAVTSLLLRRQTRADLHKSAYEAICASLPNLAQVHLEMWQEWEEPRIKDKTRDLRSMLETAFPRSIERVTLLYDTSEAIRGEYQHDITISHQKLRNELAFQLLYFSLSLKRFTCSFVLTADEFFDHYLYSTHFYDQPLSARQARMSSKIKWPYLQQITMTSPSLQPGVPASNITQLVYSAGLAALDMLHMRKFQLWHVGNDHASLLSFEHALGETSWSWETDLDNVEPFPYVPINPWLEFNTDVLYCEEPIRYKTTSIDRNRIKCRADAIYFLGLGPEVVRPISLHQMRREGRTYANV